MSGVLDPSGGIGGLPPSTQTMNPQVSSAAARYASLPTEKLQELAGVMGGSPQGQVIQSLLQQRHLHPQQPAAPAGTGVKRGGPVGRAGGGGMGMSQEDPWWTRQEAHSETGASGFLAGATPGRADSVRTTAPAGSYVLPADVVAGLGEGNSLAGARVLQEMMASGPYGTPLGRAGPSRSLPHPQASEQPQARGGETRGGAAAAVPVLLSHGEFVFPPEHVKAIGKGNLKLGHKILDRFVTSERAKQIKKLQKLPGPVKT